MGVPTSEVGNTSAMPRREDHEVHKDMWGHWEEKKNKCIVLLFILKPQSDSKSGLCLPQRFLASYCGMWQGVVNHEKIKKVP